MPFDNNRPRLAVVGATGAVGREILSILETREFSFGGVDMIASVRGAGCRIDFEGSSHTVVNLEAYDFTAADIAFFSAGGEVSKRHAPRAARAGALVIDNTNAFRMEPDVPLIVPQVNGCLLSKAPTCRIVANPNCSTIQMLRALAPIDRVQRVETLFCSTYQAVSGGGLSGMEELRASTRALLDGLEAPAPCKFPTDIGFNTIPQIDVFLDGGLTLEEQKMRQETKKILNRAEISVIPFAVRVPVLNGHCVAVVVQCQRAIDLQAVRKALLSDPDIMVHEIDQYPNIHDVAGQDQVHIARLHGDSEDPKRLYFWVVADNLRVGAALNAVQIAETALHYECIR